MYSKIVDEYLTNYQNAVGTVLDDANTIEQMKQESLKSLEEQKKNTVRWEILRLLVKIV